jgi:serine/threonine-protein kinase PpkA
VSTIAMPASLAWRVLGTPARGLERIDARPRIPGYRALREIGTGRRSSCWLARDEQQGIEVALKLQPAIASTLHREWELASNIASPHVVRLHDHGRFGAWAYLAMEAMAGGDLRQHIGKPLAADEALDLVRQAALGLAELHRRGIVHRDLKPANLLLREAGSVALSDFGLGARSGTKAATAAGVLTGTPRYIAPEQLAGAVATPAADVYSLGVLLHELLCGRPPYPGETMMEVLSQHLFAAPARLPGALAPLQPLVDRMLAKEVQTRLPDADAVLGLIGQRCLK